MHLLMTTIFAGSLLFGLSVAQPLPEPFNSPPTVAAATEATPNPWRYTRNGWEDSRQWTLAQEQIRVEWIDQIHPLLWTTLVVLAGLIALIGLSDDVTCDRLLRRPANAE